MDDIMREKLLKIALVAVGAIFFTIYPLSLIWPSGWQWHGGHGQYYFQMICGVYAVLGTYLIAAARNPSEHRSLISFTVWSSIVHAGIMAAQATYDGHEIRQQRQSTRTKTHQFGAICTTPGKSLFVWDCVVGLGGLELPTKRLSVASSEQPPSMARSRIASASLASPSCRRNGPDSTAFARSIHGPGPCRAARRRYAEPNPRRSVRPSQASLSGRAGAGSHCPNDRNDRPGAGKPPPETASGEAGAREPGARKLHANGCEARRC
jgi:hypothetical protein